MKTSTRTYKLHGFTPLLGTQPANPDVRTAYIASKGVKEGVDVSDEERMAAASAEQESGITVFLGDPDADDALSLMDYMVKGFFKEGINALEAELNVKQAASKVDKYLFIEPRVIHIERHGAPILQEDMVLERPLRAKTMQGERVTLTASERINDPWEISFTVTLVENNGTSKSASVKWEAVEAALDYGRLKGLGQWRNGGWGRFNWERID